MGSVDFNQLGKAGIVVQPKFDRIRLRYQHDLVAALGWLRSVRDHEVIQGQTGMKPVGDALRHRPVDRIERGPEQRAVSEPWLQGAAASQPGFPQGRARGSHLATLLPFPTPVKGARVVRSARKLSSGGSRAREAPSRAPSWSPRP